MNNISQFYKSLAEKQPEVLEAVRICSVPLRLTSPLISMLLERFGQKVDPEPFWRFCDLACVIRYNEKEWRLDPKLRQYFLSKFEQQNPSLASEIHGAALTYLENNAPPSLDQDQLLLLQAYHTTPKYPDVGAVLYWSTYCRARTANRPAMLPIIANLAASQAHWLADHKQDIHLYHAAALCYEEATENKQQATRLLEAILEKGASVSITIEVCFLLGRLKEQENREEAARLYEQATRLKDNLDLAKEKPEVQRHLRLTLSKSFSNLASYLQAQGTPQELDKAESYYRHAIQIVSGTEPGYEATQLRGLIGILQKRGQEDKITAPSLRISQIESPFRQVFLEKVLADFDENHDIENLYYGISALNHGLGYDHQYIQIKVAPDGSAKLEGMYTLTALSALSQLETHLETAPESKLGVKFVNVESLTPRFTLTFSPRHTKRSARAAIDYN